MFASSCAEPMLQAIQHSIVCPICRNQLKEPRVLSCGHTACSDCIADGQFSPCSRTDLNQRVSGARLTRSLRCPTCGGCTELPPEGVQGLATNHTTLDLISALATSNANCSSAPEMVSATLPDTKCSVEPSTTRPRSNTCPSEWRPLQQG